MTTSPIESDNTMPRKSMILRIVVVMVLALLCSRIADARAETATKDMPSQVKVADGSVSVAGPSGYCIDTTASHDGSKGTFLLLGSCAALNGQKSAKSPEIPAVLTVAITSRGGDTSPFRSTFEAMAHFLSSPPGRAALSRSGKANSVAILRIVADGDILYINATDTSPTKGQNLQKEYWRALLAVRGKIVTLTVLGLEEKPITSDAMRLVLKAFTDKVKALNR